MNEVWVHDDAVANWRYAVAYMRARLVAKRVAWNSGERGIVGIKERDKQLGETVRTKRLVSAAQGAAVSVVAGNSV